MTSPPRYRRARRSVEQVAHAAGESERCRQPRRFDPHQIHQAGQVARNDEVRLSFELGTDSAAVVRELSGPDVAEQAPSRLEEGGQLSLARGEVALALDEFGIRAEAGAAAEI